MFTDQNKGENIHGMRGEPLLPRVAVYSVPRQPKPAATTPDSLKPNKLSQGTEGHVNIHECPNKGPHLLDDKYSLSE